MIRFLINIWMKLSQSRAVENAGPREKAFHEIVYRLTFLEGISTSDDYLSYTIFSIIARSLSFTVVCLQLWHLFCDDLILDDMLSCINVFIIHLITLWKLTIMVRDKNVFKRLAKALDSPSLDISTQKRKDIVQYWVDTHKNYLRFLLSIAYPTLIVWQTYALLDNVEYNLMLDVKIPYEYEGHPLRYMLTYVAVGTMFHYASMMTVLADCITQSHLIPLVCQFAVLADCFENIFEECALEFQASFPEIGRHELVKNNMFVDAYLRRLSDLVTQHQVVLDQTMDLKRILSNPMLGQLACSVIINILVGYQATTTFTQSLGKFFQSLLYLSYNMLVLYLFCRWCEEITIQSQNIGQSAYFSGWESGISQAPGVRATMMLIIARSNKPLVFLAGGMYPLSLSSYTTLVKTSYSAFNLLLKTDE
ncbi:hypothetical protein PYW07_001554 [Mythimna separata]|uniref:Odorant receptor n=1 Tax=Mythimna separata TaxID=271217 RepID=A0AAD7YTM3_MYTSE|nr:hypothetical protein PYW07_001554 [Mythimna separata]